MVVCIGLPQQRTGILTCFQQAHFNTDDNEQVSTDRQLALDSEQTYPMAQVPPNCPCATHSSRSQNLIARKLVEDRLYLQSDWRWAHGA